MESPAKPQSIGLSALQNTVLSEFKQKLEAKLGLPLSRSATVMYAVSRALEQIDSEAEKETA